LNLPCLRLPEPTNVSETKVVDRGLTIVHSVVVLPKPEGGSRDSGVGPTPHAHGS